MKLVMQRGLDDCGVAALCTITGRDYEDAVRHLHLPVSIYFVRTYLACSGYAVEPWYSAEYTFASGEPIPCVEEDSEAVFLLLVRHRDYLKHSHIVVYWKGSVYDPALGMRKLRNYQIIDSYKITPPTEQAEYRI